MRIGNVKAEMACFHRLCSAKTNGTFAPPSSPEKGVGGIGPQFCPRGQNLEVRPFGLPLAVLSR